MTSLPHEGDTHDGVIISIITLRGEWGGGGTSIFTTLCLIRTVKDPSKWFREFRSLHPRYWRDTIDIELSRALRPLLYRDLNEIVFMLM